MDRTLVVGVGRTMLGEAAVRTVLERTIDGLGPAQKTTVVGDEQIGARRLALGRSRV